MSRRTVVVDIEADGLTNVKNIWCIVAKDIKTNEVFKFRPSDPLSAHRSFSGDFITFVEQEVETVIGHNFLGYDLPVINSLIKEDLIKPSQVIDTLALSRLFRPTTPYQYPIRWKGRLMDTRVGGHSLSAWGKRLNCHKYDFDDFSKFSEDMLDYCVQDVHVCHKVYDELMIEKELYEFSDESVRLELDVVWALRTQEMNGFFLDKEKAESLRDSTKALLDAMNYQLQLLFPPLWVLEKVLEMKVTKSGAYNKVSLKTLERYQSDPTKKAEQNPDGTYNLYEQEVFNPDSGIQVAKRLLAIGWKPKRFTEKGAPKTDRETMQEALQELIRDNPSMEALRYLADYGIVGDRYQRVLKWLELASYDGRIHGQVISIGAWTHRSSHKNDNMANVARVETSKEPITNFSEVDFGKVVQFQEFAPNKHFLKVKDGQVEYALSGLAGGFGWDCRDLWTVPPNSGLVLVGADAAGIQLRALAHYMGDPDYIKELLEGDIHEVNRRAAGIDTRPTAKTFIYAWLLGAGDEKIGSIVGVKPEEVIPLIKWAKGVKLWKQTLLDKIQRQLFESGRDPKDKMVLASIIKGYKTKRDFLEKLPALKRLKEKDIPAAVKLGYVEGLDGRKIWVENAHLAMGAYLQGFEAVIMKKVMQLYQSELMNLNIPFKQVAYVHDEFCVETKSEYGVVVGQTIIKAIRMAGEIYGSKCPLDGEYRVGKAWSQVH